MSLRCSDGAFMGDCYGEIDTRYCYAAVATLILLYKLYLRNIAKQTPPLDERTENADVSNRQQNAFKLSTTDLKKTANYLHECQNRDGGFGQSLQGESHGGQVFCCVAALALLNELLVQDCCTNESETITERLVESSDFENVQLEKYEKLICKSARDQSVLVGWLVERQNRQDGGLNGRPEKLSDVCYSWWILSALRILDAIHLIDHGKLVEFILLAQVRILAFSIFFKLSFCL